MHIKVRGQQTDFHLTESFCLYWWHKLNVAVFDSMLTPPVRFELKAYRGAGGWCKPWRHNAKERRVTIGINTDIWERQAFLSVLAHEMVHQWEWEVQQEWNPKINHGKNFYSWTNKLLTRVGLPLTETVYI